MFRFSTILFSILALPLSPFSPLGAGRAEDKSSGEYLFWVSMDTNSTLRGVSYSGLTFHVPGTLRILEESFIVSESKCSETLSIRIVASSLSIGVARPQ